MHNRKQAFTIVELLIIIVVIGILAAITIVAYRGFSRQAELSSVKITLRQAGVATEASRVESGTYPSTSPANISASISESSTQPYNYYQRISGASYCIDVYSASFTDIQFYITDTSGGIQEGLCTETPPIGGGPPVAATDEACFNTLAVTGGVDISFYRGGISSSGYLSQASLDGTNCPLDVVIPGTIGGQTVVSISDIYVWPGGAFTSRSLTSVIIPSSVVIIGERSFRNNLITSVTIPVNVTFIGFQAFAQNQLTSVTIPPSVSSIDQFAFSNNNLSTVAVPLAATIGFGAFDPGVTVTTF